MSQQFNEVKQPARQVSDSSGTASPSILVRRSKMAAESKKGARPFKSTNILDVPKARK